MSKPTPSGKCCNCTYFVKGDMHCDYYRKDIINPFTHSGCDHYQVVGQNENEELGQKSNCLESFQNGGDCDLECHLSGSGTCPDFRWTGTERGKKFDEEKRRTDLFPFEAFNDISDVLTYGAGKYGDRNWEKGIAYHRMFGAAMRHLIAWWLREDKDPESGLSHLAHAACNLCFLLWHEYNRPDLDDRPGGTNGQNS